MAKLIQLVCYLTLCFPLVVSAHSGGLNKQGCHNNTKTGDYHCHRSQSKPVTKVTSTKFIRSDYGFDSYKASTNIGFYTEDTCDSVHIDHVVSLKDAHVSGAMYWSNSLKEDFANDRENHRPACGSVNISKSASTPSEFLRKSQDGRGLDYEIDSFCEYINIYFYIKEKYQLSTANNDLSVLSLCN